MRVKVLGSAAGGGVPQWNCNYEFSRLARAGSPLVKPRLQSSLAVSSDNGRGWVVLNASPDIRQQIAETMELQPDSVSPLRSTPIAAVVLTNADVDHIAGLLSLRERQPFHLYGTRRVLETLRANSIFGVLDPSVVTRIELPFEAVTPIAGPAGPTGISIETFPVAGKVALFLETGGGAQDFNAHDGDTIGTTLRADTSEAKVSYVPGCAAVDDCLRTRLDGSDVMLFDGTVYRDDEMALAGVGSKTGQRMGHLAMSGPGGSIKQLETISIGRRVFIHINNTNPVLREDSIERDAVTVAGWEVAYDGMEFIL